MKYFPLIWAALWRKPTEFLLTLLSMSAAFTLFGIMIGFNATMQRMIESSQPDIVYVYSRFGALLPLAYRDQILHLPGIAKISFHGIAGGYYQDKKNNVFAYMVSDGFRDIFSEFQMTPAEWNRLRASRTNVFVSRDIAARYHLKPGDAFPVLTYPGGGGSGSNLWSFTVAGILDDIPTQYNGFVIGNYEYLDQSRPPALRGLVNTFDILAKDPNRAGDTAKAVDALFANSYQPTLSITDRAEFERLARAGINVPFVTMVVAGAGLFMILFLVANGIAQSVRERIPEFAVLKTLGFSDGLVMALVFVEATIPCLLGAAIGLGLATEFAREMPRLMPSILYYSPPPYMSASVLGLGLVSAALVALLSSVIPALRLKRLDVASALSGR